MNRKITTVLSALFLVAQLVPTQATGSEPTDIIPGQYIVVYKDSISNPRQITRDLSARNKVAPTRTFDRVINGFAAPLSPTQLTRLRQDSRVGYIVSDRVVSIDRVDTTRATDRSNRPHPPPPPPPPPAPPPNPPPSPVPSPTPPSTPPSTPSGQVVPPNINRLGRNQSNQGDGIGVAVIDTGIDLTHPDLAANIIASHNCLTSSQSATDDNGHGTHVAGIIAAADNDHGVVGVAPKAKLIAVKALDANGYGTWSSILCGIDWVTSVAPQYNIKVANLSLGGRGTSDNACGENNHDPLHAALCKSAAAGVTYAVAAGNATNDAANLVPAAYDDAVITVSALADSDGRAGGMGSPTKYGADDTFANFSGYGSPVDLAAPGVSIISTWLNGGYAVVTGTSMASPSVAGAAALYLKNHPTAAWRQVRDELQAVGEKLNAGHTDPSQRHPEPVILTGGL